MEGDYEIGLILDWADTHPNFDTTLVESMRQQIEQGRKLSERQLTALDNIIEGFKIER